MPRPPGSRGGMPTADSSTGQAAKAARLDSLWSRAERAWRDTQAAWARAQAIQSVNAQLAKPSPQELQAESRLARLQAQLASMPVIEQAKGVLMARQGCDAGQASELLRRASQRSSVPVRDLAEQIVQNTQRRRGAR